MKRSPLLYYLLFLFLLVIAVVPAGAFPYINYITPSSGPDNGVVTVTIVGSGFDSGSTSVYLTPADNCDPSIKIYGTIKSRTPNTMTAAFSLSGKTTGRYTMWVNSPTSLGEDDKGSLFRAFEIYKGTGSIKTTTTTKTKTTTVRTTETRGDGENSVFFQTDPDGATIFLNGDEVGMSTFTYYTNKEGVFDVLIKKTGYEDYPARLSIIEGKRVTFYAPLTQLSSSNTTTITTKTTGTPVKNATPIRKSTLKIPTPMGTDPPVTEESPADPAFALGAVVLGILIFVIRRR